MGKIKYLFLAALLIARVSPAFGEVRVPAFTAYLIRDPNGGKVSSDGVTSWTNPKITISWFGEIKTAGTLDAAVILRLPQGR